MKNKILISALLVALLLASASCVRADNKEKDTVSDTTVQAAENKDTETQSSSSDFFKTDEETFEIETPYCPLKYPVKWRDYVKTETIQSGESYGVSFTAVFGEKSFSLYTLVFGDALEGYKLGAVETDKGVIDVYLIDTYDEAAEALPENEKLTYYQMCEDVNVIISKLVYDNGMVLAD